jgi:CRP-like cAMP-binding protein
LPIEIANPVELLRNVPLFSACTDAEIRVLLKIAQRRSIPAGTVVVEEGADDDRFYASSAGEVRVTRGQRELATFGPGGFFGEVAMLDRGPRTATVTATGDLLVYAIDGQAFRGSVAGSAGHLGQPAPGPGPSAPRGRRRPERLNARRRPFLSSGVG